MLTRWVRRGGAVGLAVAALVVAGCSRSGYQYLESEDDHVFAKIPDDWQITAMGIVDPSIRPEGATSFSVLPGDDTLPWRAQFTSDAGGKYATDQPAGYIDVQPVDSRLRDSLDIELALPYVADDETDGYEEVERRVVESDDLRGLRVTYTVTDGGTELVNERLMLTDARNTVLYVVQIGCEQECFDAHREVIDEVLRTFRVEDA